MKNKGITTNHNKAIEPDENEENKVNFFDKPIHIRARSFIRHEKALLERFDKHYINIVGKAPSIFQNKKKEKS